jgi:hypothetical protein
MLRFSSTPLSNTLSQTSGGSSLTIPVSPYNWKIELYHNSGGLKKVWNIGQGKCPIKSLAFELNKKLMGTGTLELVELDFPIHARDYIKVYWKGELKYCAQVESGIDPKGGKIKLTPFLTLFQRFYVFNVFVLQTVEEMFETIVSAISSKTGIQWNPFYVDTGTVETFSPDYSAGETSKKVLEDYIVKCDDREYGADANNIFHVYQMDADVSQNLFTKFETVDNKKEYTQIKETRLYVFRKDALTNTTILCGTVGNGGLYPILSDIEVLTGGERWGKYTVSDVVLTDVEALDIAYAYLVANCVIPDSTSIKNVDLNFYFPVIGAKIRAVDSTEKILRNIIDCDSLINWSSGTLDTTIYTQGLSSIKFDNIYDNILVYDFGKLQRWHHPTKIGFMLRTSCAGQYLSFSTAKYKNGTHGSGVHGMGLHGIGTPEVTNYLWLTSQNIYISTGSVWQWHEFDLTTDFRYFGIRFNGTPSVSPCYAWIDEVSLFLYDKSTYEGNIVLAKFMIDQKGDSTCDITLDQYNLFANDKLFENTRKIEKLEAIANVAP